MTTITFDTLKYANRLKAAGFEERQAEALAEAQAEIQDKSLSELATRGDLNEGLKELEIRLIKWVAAMFIAQSALIVGAVFALLRAFSGH